MYVNLHQSAGGFVLQKRVCNLHSMNSQNDLRLRRENPQLRHNEIRDAPFAVEKETETLRLTFDRLTERDYHKPNQNGGWLFYSASLASLVCVNIYRPDCPHLIQATVNINLSWWSSWSMISFCCQTSRQMTFYTAFVNCNTGFFKHTGYLLFNN